VPSPGLQAFHASRPLEFLYLIRRGIEGETWRVRTLMVEPAQEFDEFVRCGESLKPLHRQVDR
jgi:hypothetical protein